MQSPESRFTRFVPVILLLWGFLAIRLVDIEQFPYFVDELHHINRARIVWSFSNLHVSTTPGKFLLYYYLGLFGMPDHLPGWIARTPIALFGMIGMAGTMALTQHFFSRWAGWLAGLVMVFFPLMLFHERLALTDPFAGSLAIVMAWWTLHVIRNPTRRRTLGLSVLICLMLSGKLLTLPLLIAPLLAVFLFSGDSYRQGIPIWPQLRAMWAAYRPAASSLIRIVGGVWFVILLLYVGRGLLDPADTNPLFDNYIYQSEDRAATISENVGHVADVFRYFWGEWLFVLNVGTIGLVSWKRPRTAFYLLALVLPLWIVLTLVSARPNSRYLTVVGHFWIVLLAGGIYLATKDIRTWTANRLPRLQFIQWLPLGLVILWVMTYGLWFADTLHHDPVALELPEGEIRAYYQNITGFGLQPALQSIETRAPVSEGFDVPVVLGVGRLCGYWHYHLAASAHMHLECVGAVDGERTGFLDSRLQALGKYYLIHERSNPLETSVDADWIAEHATLIDLYERPFHGVPVEVYLIK